MTRRERKGASSDAAVAESARAGNPADVRREIERLRSELAELQRVNRLKDQVLSVAAHELATPLTAIKAYAETLQEHWGEPGFEQGPEFLGVLQRESARLMRIVDRTLQLSRLTSVTQTLQRRPLALSEVVHEVVATLRPVYRERGVLLDVHVAEGLRLCADRDLLGQVLINLLDNAVKFSPRGSSVVLRAQASAQALHIEVRDQGFGIAAEELQRIFDPYFRSRDERIGHSRGIGLGLALVKTVVEQHGGRIEVESQIDRGTVFRFSMPLE